MRNPKRIQEPHRQTILILIGFRSMRQCDTTFTAAFLQPTAFIDFNSDS